MRNLNELLPRRRPKFSPLIAPALAAIAVGTVGCSEIGSDLSEGAELRQIEQEAVIYDHQQRRYICKHNGASMNAVGAHISDFQTFERDCLKAGWNTNVVSPPDPRDPVRVNLAEGGSKSPSEPITVHVNELGERYRLCHTGARVGVFWDARSSEEDWKTWSTTCLAEVYTGAALETEFIVNHKEREPDTKGCGDFNPTTKAQYPITRQQDGDGNWYRACHTGADVGVFYESGATYGDWDAWRNDCLGRVIEGGGGVGILPDSIVYQRDPLTGGPLSDGDCETFGTKARYPITRHQDGNGKWYRQCNTGADVGTFYESGATYADFDAWRNSCLGISGGGGWVRVPREADTLQTH